MAFTVTTLTTPSDYLLITHPGTSYALAYQFRGDQLTQVDAESSNSCQHYIETGRWLTHTEAAEHQLGIGDLS